MFLKKIKNRCFYPPFLLSNKQPLLICNSSYILLSDIPLFAGINFLIPLSYSLYFVIKHLCQCKCSILVVYNTIIKITHNILCIHDSFIILVFFFISFFCSTSCFLLQTSNAHKSGGPRTLKKYI